MKDLNDADVVQERFSVQAAGELLRTLAAYNHQFTEAGLSGPTLRGWFSFSGKNNAAAVPKLNKTFVNGVQDGLRRTQRHFPLLHVQLLDVLLPTLRI